MLSTRNVQSNFYLLQQLACFRFAFYCAILYDVYLYIYTSMSVSLQFFLLLFIIFAILLGFGIWAVVEKDTVSSTNR